MCIIEYICLALFVISVSQTSLQGLKQIIIESCNCSQLAYFQLKKPSRLIQEANKPNKGCSLQEEALKAYKQSTCMFSVEEALKAYKQEAIKPIKFFLQLR